MSKDSGVGMPAGLWLNEFGSLVMSAFDEVPYQVGSSIAGAGKPWRDVDVRVILDDAVWEAMGLGDPERTHSNGKWVAMCLAFSTLGKAMTGLPIDFQLQQRTQANAKYRGPDDHRSALGFVPLRMEHLAAAPPATKPEGT